MSSVWAPLLPVAMVGTDRHAAPLPPWPGEIGATVAAAAAAADTPAAAALRAAAVLAACSLAGVQGRAWTAALPAPAAAESRPALADPALEAVVEWALEEAPLRLAHHILAALDRAGLRLPAALLPAALELGRQAAGIRSGLQPVLGSLGLWLAGQRESWQYAAGVDAGATDESRWTDGGLEQRRAFLAEARRRDPPAARDRLLQVLPELPARERAVLAGELASGLSLDDEPLLETLRTDRSREVRLVALALLLRLPQAAHPQRAIGRLAKLLTRQHVLIRPRWLIDAPDALPEAWLADNVDAPRPKHESLGERGWWLYQLVRQVPLAWWTAHTGLTPAELLEWAEASDWAEALLRGWRDVLLAAPDEAWADAMVDRWPTTVLRVDATEVIALLPMARRERHWLRHLHAGAPPLAQLVAQILNACPFDETLPPALSAALVERLEGLAAAGTLGNDHALRGALPQLAAALHPASLHRLADLPRHPDERPSFAEALYVTERVVAARLAIATLPSTPRTP